MSQIIQFPSPPKPLVRVDWPMGRRYRTAVALPTEHGTVVVELLDASGAVRRTSVHQDADSASKWIEEVEP